MEDRCGSEQWQISEKWWKVFKHTQWWSVWWGKEVWVKIHKMVQIRIRFAGLLSNPEQWSTQTFLNDSTALHSDHFVPQTGSVELAQSATSGVYQHILVRSTAVHITFYTWCTRRRGLCLLAPEEEGSVYQHIGLKTEEETSKMVHLEHSFIWCWNLDDLCSRSETPGKFSNVVLEKDGEDQLYRSCEKWRSVT